jgi:hypothetical protein
MTWTCLSKSAVGGSPPTPRKSHGFTSAGGKLYVHGGAGDRDVGPYQKGISFGREKGGRERDNRHGGRCFRYRIYDCSGKVAISGSALVDRSITR